MTVEEYANELNVDVNVVIKKSKELGFNYKNADDILDDDAIVMLDNELTQSTDENNLTEELADKFELEDMIIMLK